MHPAIVEKDFWVCWMLDYLFGESTFRDSFAFKGSTSLSKGFGLIERFSEDIDLIFDWRLLGYGLDEQQIEGASLLIDCSDPQTLRFSVLDPSQTSPSARNQT